MGIKKKSIFPVNLSNEAVQSIQRLGFINGKKQSTGKKNLSEFVSQLIVEFVGLNFPKDHKYIQEKILKLELYDFQKRRDKLEDAMQTIANKLVAIKESNQEAKN